MGSSNAARRAGQRPKNKPTSALKKNATRMAKRLMEVFQCAIFDSPTPDYYGGYRHGYRRWGRVY